MTKMVINNEPRQPKPLILFADASLTMRKVAELQFGSDGFQVVTANRGDRAKEYIARIKPDIVLVDVCLPGVDGYDICAWTKSHSPALPVVLITGAGEPFDPDRADSSGCDAVVTKPFHAIATTDFIRRLLHLHIPIDAFSVRVADEPPLEPEAGRVFDFLDLDVGPHPLSVFICHAKEDKPVARGLFDLLFTEGFVPWLDEMNLLPGEDWNLAIQRAIRTTDVVAVLLSAKAVSKSGYVQKEITFALDVLAEKPEGTIFLVPVLIDDCKIPDKLKHLHAAKLAESAGLGKLISALKARAKSLGRSSSS